MPFENPSATFPSESTLLQTDPLGAVSPPPRGGERTERDCMARETRQKKGDPGPRKKVKPASSKPTAKPLKLAKPTAKASAAKPGASARVVVKPHAKPDPKQGRAAEIFREQSLRNHVRTDRVFAVLMVVQWVVGIIVTLT